MLVKSYYSELSKKKNRLTAAWLNHTKKIIFENKHKKTIYNEIKDMKIGNDTLGIQNVL